jgi:hypothetical protein
MTIIPPPWVIEELEDEHRRREARDRPRLDVPHPPPARPADDEPDAPVTIVIKASAR